MATPHHIANLIYRRSLTLSMVTSWMIESFDTQGGGHLNMHVLEQLSSVEEDYHLDETGFGGQKYYERNRHSMFRSGEEAVRAAHASLTCEAGWRAMLALKTNNKVVLKSRTGSAWGGGLMKERTRSDIGEGSFTEKRSDFIVMVFKKKNHQAVIQTCYPAIGNNPHKDPPLWKDRLEVGHQSANYNARMT